VALTGGGAGLGGWAGRCLVQADSSQPGRCGCCGDCPYRPGGAVPVRSLPLASIWMGCYRLVVHSMVRRGAGLDGSGDLFCHPPAARAP
jgi:hypothetical protein